MRWEKKGAHKKTDAETSRRRTIVNRIESMDDVLLLMRTLHRYQQRKIVYHAIKEKIADMTPTFDELVQLMEYLSLTKCAELCQILPVSELAIEDLETSKALLRSRLSDDKITLLKTAFTTAIDATASKEAEGHAETAAEYTHSPFWQPPSTSTASRASSVSAATLPDAEETNTSAARHGQ